MRNSDWCGVWRSRSLNNDTGNPADPKWVLIKMEPHFYGIYSGRYGTYQNHWLYVKMWIVVSKSRVCSIFQFRLHRGELSVNLSIEAYFLLFVRDWILCIFSYHYNDVIMSAMASQITSLTVVFSAVYSGADQRKHQRSASLAFMGGIHPWPANSPHKRPATRKMFPFDDVIMEPWKDSSARMLETHGFEYRQCHRKTTYIPAIRNNFPVQVNDKENIYQTTYKIEKYLSQWKTTLPM